MIGFGKVSRVTRLGYTVDWEKKNTLIREAIPPFQCLSITLRYLATGNILEDLKFYSAISPQSLSLVIMETCNAIIQVLRHIIKVRKKYY